ncbi:MAG: O-antigen ligase family protein [Actinobacteria bacterium]|nr:O-antigen ligase family protein [Actinomycetota bacterium]
MSFYTPPVEVRSSASEPDLADGGSDTRFGVLEWSYALVIVQTALVNPVLVDFGSLQLYANTITWPLLAAGAAVRWIGARDRPLSSASNCLIVGSGAVIWLIILQGTITGFDQHATGNLLRLLYVPIGIIAALAVYRSIDRLLDIAIVALGVKAVIVLVGFVGGTIGLQNRLTLPELGGHNTLGSFLVFIVVLRASTWVLGGRKPSGLVIASLLAMLACVFVTFSRGAFVTLVAGLLALMGLALRRQQWRGRSLRASILLLLVLVPLLVSGPLQERLTALSFTQSSGRNEIWRPAWDGFVDHPATGSGFGSFDVYSRFLVDPLNPTGNTTYSAHNLTLQILFEGGIIGFLAVALATWLLLRRCWSVVMLPCALAVFVDSFFETFPYVVQVSWVYGLIFAVGLRHRLNSDNSPVVATAMIPLATSHLGAARPRPAP